MSRRCSPSVASFPGPIAAAICNSKETAMTPTRRSILAAAAFATAGAFVSPALAAEKVPFTLSWKLMGPHSPFFLAVDRGYFAAEGLELDIAAGDGSANVVNRITSGAFLFGSG